MDKISEIHDILTATILPPCHQMIYDIVSQTTAKQLKMVKDKKPTSASASGPEARAETEARAVVSTVKASKVKQNPGQTPQQTTDPELHTSTSTSKTYMIGSGTHTAD